MPPWAHSNWRIALFATSLPMSRFFVGITGASGHIYARTLIRTLLNGGHEVDLCLTAAGALVLEHELGIQVGREGFPVGEQLEQWLGPRSSEAVRSFAPAEVGAPAASGTALSGGAIICPCSMGTLSRICLGFSSNLVERVADVALKEGRPLIVVPRESPLSQIHLENMLRLARLGGVILPAAPGFYHGPKSIDDLVEHLVGKLLDRIGVEHSLGKRWSGLSEPETDPGAGIDPPPDPMLTPAHPGAASATPGASADNAEARPGASDPR